MSRRDPLREYEALQIQIDNTDDPELRKLYFERQNLWLKLAELERQTAAFKQPTASTLPLVTVLADLPEKMSTTVSDVLTAKILVASSNMLSLAATPESARTPPVVLENSHQHTAANPDHTYDNVRAEVDIFYYLDQIEMNFTLINGGSRYQWVTTPNHFLLKDHSKSGSSSWIYKRNLNIVNARNTLLELHSVNYDLIDWLGTDFSAMDYENINTPLEL